MATDAKLKPFVSRLIELVMVDGTVDEARVGQVLEGLRAHPPRQYRRILQIFAMRVRNRLRETTLRVETAAELSATTSDRLWEHFSQLYGRKLALEVEQRPDLIAGLRLRVADDVYEDNLHSRLQQLI